MNIICSCTINTWLLWLCIYFTCAIICQRMKYEYLLSNTTYTYMHMYAYTYEYTYFIIYNVIFQKITIYILITLNFHYRSEINIKLCIVGCSVFCAFVIWSVCHLCHIFSNSHILNSNYWLENEHIKIYFYL